MEQHSASGKAKIAVIGGSNGYVKTFTASFTGTLHLSSEVRRITRMENGVQDFGSGFHEDAVRSSYQAVAHLRTTALRSPKSFR